MNTSPVQKYGWFGLPKPLVIGVGVAVIGMLFSMTISSSRSMNGVVTQCTYIDVGAFLVAIACAVLLLVGVTRWRAGHRRAGDGQQLASPALFYGLCALVALMTVVHVLRGFGVIGGIC